MAKPQTAGLAIFRIASMASLTQGLCSNTGIFARIYATYGANSSRRAPFESQVDPAMFSTREGTSRGQRLHEYGVSLRFGA